MPPQRKRGSNMSDSDTLSADPTETPPGDPAALPMMEVPSPPMFFSDTGNRSRNIYIYIYLFI